MKAVIETVKSEIERLRPLVEEYHRLENLLALLESPRINDLKPGNESVIEKRGKHGDIRVIVDSSMPEDIRNLYNIKIGDTFHSMDELIRVLGIHKNVAYRWKLKEGWIKELHKTRYNFKTTSVRILDTMPEKIRIKYKLTVGDFWHSINDMKDKLGISYATVKKWREMNAIEYFTL